MPFFFLLWSKVSMLWNDVKTGHFECEFILMPTFRFKHAKSGLSATQ